MPFNKVYHLYYIKIYQFLFRLTLSGSDSEDIVQEVFMKLHTEMKKNNTPDNIKAWLYKCALNKFINQKKRKRVVLLSDNINQFENESTDTIENDIVKDEKKKLVAKALLTLSNKERAIVNLYNDDCSYKEISEIVGIKQSSVGKTLSRIIDKLVVQIKSSNHEELFGERNII